MTYVLVPAMKAAGIDQRNDPRVAHFLQTYAEAKRRLVSGLLAQVAPPPPMVAEPPRHNPVPSKPPVADLPLTEAELEAMASPAPSQAPTMAAPTADMTSDMTPMAGGPEAPEVPDLPPAVPAGLLSDDEFKAKFPSIAPGDVMDVPVEPEPSLMKLASQAITPKLPAEPDTSESSEVGSAPTEPAPSSPAQSKASTEVVSADTANAAVPAAETTDTSTASVKQAENTTEAHHHG